MRPFEITYEFYRSMWNDCTIFGKIVYFPLLVTCFPIIFLATLIFKLED